MKIKKLPEPIGIFGCGFGAALSVTCFIGLFNASILGIFLLIIAISFFNLITAALYLTSEAIMSTEPRIDSMSKVEVATLLFCAVCWPLGLLYGIFYVCKWMVVPFLIIADKFVDVKTDGE